MKIGFLDLLGAIFQYGIEKSQENKEQVEKYKAQYERYDDEQLKKKFLSSSGACKMACGLLLKERGY